MSDGLATVDILTNLQIPIQSTSQQEHIPGCATNAG
jgi:hypothetical protein